MVYIYLYATAPLPSGSKENTADQCLEQVGLHLKCTWNLQLTTVLFLNCIEVVCKAKKFAVCRFGLLQIRTIFVRYGKFFLMQFEIGPQGFLKNILFIFAYKYLSINRQRCDGPEGLYYKFENYLLHPLKIIFFCLYLNEFTCATACTVNNNWCKHILCSYLLIFCAQKPFSIFFPGVTGNAPTQAKKFFIFQNLF